MNLELYNEDFLKTASLMPDECVDLVVTDPPYKTVQGGCTNHAVKLKGSELEDLQKGRIFGTNVIKFSQWIPEVYRLLKKGTHCYIMCNDRNLQEVLNEGTKAGFRVLNVLVWGKSKHSPNRYYLKNCEFIVMFRKGTARNINNMGTKQLLQVPNVPDKKHPSEKPVDLMKILVKNSSEERDTVLDPFMGVGSTGEACGLLNRYFIGVEISEKYFKIAKERLNG